MEEWKVEINWLRWNRDTMVVDQQVVGNMGTKSAQIINKITFCSYASALIFHNTHFISAYDIADLFYIATEKDPNQRPGNCVGSGYYCRVKYSRLIIACIPAGQVSKGACTYLSPPSRDQIPIFCIQVHLYVYKVLYEIEKRNLFWEVLVNRTVRDSHYFLYNGACFYVKFKGPSQKPVASYKKLNSEGL